MKRYTASKDLTVFVIADEREMERYFDDSTDEEYVLGSELHPEKGVKAHVYSVCETLRDMEHGAVIKAIIPKGRSTASHGICSR